MTAVLTIPEVARRLRVNTSTLYRSIDAGTFPLPYWRSGSARTIRVSEAMVELLLAGQIPAPSAGQEHHGRVVGEVGPAVVAPNEDKEPA